jgi:hypothetical protein
LINNQGEFTIQVDLDENLIPRITAVQFSGPESFTLADTRKAFLEASNNRLNADFLCITLLIDLLAIPPKKNQAQSPRGPSSKCNFFRSKHFSDLGFDTVCDLGHHGVNSKRRRLRHLRKEVLNGLLPQLAENNG